MEKIKIDYKLLYNALIQECKKKKERSGQAPKEEDYFHGWSEITTNFWGKTYAKSEEELELARLISDIDSKV